MRLIDADALKRSVNKLCDKLSCEDMHISTVETEIDCSPTVDAVEVVHGRWSDVTTICGLKFVKCSVCDYREYHHTYQCNRFKYCPICGAKMDGGNNNATD